MSDTAARPITVIITTRNKATLLSQAIESVLRSPLIASPTDILVVDDDSTDHTASVAGEHGVRYARVKRGSCGGTRNAGLALADTPFVAFLDDDDVWLPGNLEPHLDALLQNREAAYAFGKVQPTDLDLSPDGTVYPNPPAAIDPVSCALYHTAQIGVILFRRSSLLAVGGFDERIRYTEDKDLQVRLALRYSSVAIDHVGVLYRIRPWSAHEADYNWIKMRDCRPMHRRWRADGMPRSVLLKAALRARGTLSYHCCRSARHAVAIGERKLALRELGHALRISPFHSLMRHQIFWSTVKALLNVHPTPQPAPIGTHAFW